LPNLKIEFRDNAVKLKIMAKKEKIGVVIYAAAIIIVLAGAMLAKSIVTHFLLALFISIICAEPIQWLQRKKVPQSLAILMVFIGILAIFFIFGVVITESLSSFSENSPLYEKNLKDLRDSFFHFLSTQGIKVSTETIKNLINPTKIMGLTAQFLGQLGGLLGSTLTVIFLVLFALMELDSIPIKINAITKNTKESVSFINVIGKNIRHYLTIKTLTSLLTGVLVWICLAVIGIDYAVIWGLLAFLLNYIPNIGSIIAAFPTVVFSMIQLGLAGAIGSSLVFVVVNMVIGNVVEPKMMGDGLGLSTFVVFFSLIFWGFIFGSIGMFLSVPLTMAIKIMLEQNPNTKAFAIILGTQREAQSILNTKHLDQKQE